METTPNVGLEDLDPQSLGSTHSFHKPGPSPLPAGPLTCLQSEGLNYRIAKALGSSVGLHKSPIKDKYQIVYSFFF